MRPDRLDIALSALPCRGPRRHLRMGTTTRPQAETNACGATGSRKGSETRQTRAGDMNRWWSGRARPCVTGALCEGTDETDPTQREADARRMREGMRPSYGALHTPTPYATSRHTPTSAGEGLVRRVTQTETAMSAATGCSGSERRRWWRNSYGLLTCRGQGLCSGVTGANIASRTQYSLQTAPRSSSALPPHLSRRDMRMGMLGPMPGKPVAQEWANVVPRTGKAGAGGLYHIGERSERVAWASWRGVRVSPGASAPYAASWHV
jgi:hypothetical protein